MNPQLQPTDDMKVYSSNAHRRGTTGMFSRDSQHSEEERALERMKSEE
jgi:hypothetical protein